ncbi:MAG: malto-oligosyltrehalose trehalohydrolase [Myxococcota bacterium]|nr:malto-oligosyltrehalose trehalohydrolase [Myxococcota bacterium]
MGRRLPVGAEPIDGGVHFRVWAPGKERVDLVIEGGESVRLEPERSPGYWSTIVRGAGHGTRYRLRIDGDEALFPDPASRSQPDGPHGASEVIDPTRFAWSDEMWRGRALEEAVIYELHVGTFTREGTWRSASQRLAELAEMGITVIEMMPIADFPGRFGWGYDGVALFAPYHGYGAPDDLRRFVDSAHSVGLSVILDVVYNHFGPDGNYLRAIAPSAFTDRYETDWGEPLDYDGPDAGPVRELVLANVRHWIDEYHFDGLRIDATQNIYDFGEGEHIIAAVARVAREAAGARTTIVVGENEPQDVQAITAPERGGHGLDALWNDDFHHSITVALTGRCEAYYLDYCGSPQELVSAAKYGFLYQGQRYHWQSQRRGTPALDVGPRRLVAYLEDHDQVANSCDGRRLHQLTSPSRHRAATALLLLGPATPMLFQGEEFLSSAPFLYFADHHEGLAPLVRVGRAEFMGQFPSVALPEVKARLHDPADPSAFERSKLDHAERDQPQNAAHLAMTRALLSMRRDDPVLGGAARRAIDGAVVGERAFVLRYFGRGDHDDRLLVVNLGRCQHLRSVAEPLFAPPLGMRWRNAFASEDPAWGGRGCVPVEQDDGLHLTAECTVVLVPEPDETRRFRAPPEKKRAPQTGEDR